MVVVPSFATVFVVIRGAVSVLSGRSRSARFVCAIVSRNFRTSGNASIVFLSDRFRVSTDSNTFQAIYSTMRSKLTGLYRETYKSHTYLGLHT